MDFSSIPEHVISAVHALEGKTLTCGWSVLEQVKRKPGSTGGNFSVCYLVERDGKKGFLKALNILSFLDAEDSDIVKATADSLNSFNFEKELMEKCAAKNLSKVSKLLDAGSENFSGFLIKNVHYLIFELAQGDVRVHLDFADSVDMAWKLRSLHNIVTGIKQLHSINIGHQDIKPSNVFIYDDLASKLGDLGRSLSQEISGPHSDLNFTGDWKYAPPEIYHKFYIEDWNERVHSIDCYLFGSMVCFYLTGQSMTSIMVRNVSADIEIFSYKFEEALAFWVEAFERSLVEIGGSLDDYEDKEQLIDQIRMLCNPDPKSRGHRKNHSMNISKYGLERFVTIFNVLAKKAEFRIIK